jgi:hypothetical protein
MRRDLQYAGAAFRRARAWIAEKMGRFSAEALSGPVSVLESAIADMDKAAIEQELLRVSLGEKSVTRRRIRRELWSFHMRPVLAVAQELAKADPIIGSEVRMSYRRPSDVQLIVSAAAIAQAVESREKLFQENGLAPGFLDRLRAKADEFSAVIEAHGAERARRVGATKTLDVAVATGKRSVRLIDMYIRSSVLDEELRTEWDSVRRYLRRGLAVSASGGEGAGSEGGSVAA